MSATTSGNNIPSQIAEALSSSSKADFEKVAIAVGVFAAATLVTLVAFEVLRPNNKIVYEPKRKYADAGGPAPPSLSYKFLGWIGPVWRYSEDDLLDNVGMDAIVFMRFLRLCALITTVLAVVLGATLIPVDLVYNLNSKNPDLGSKSSALSAITLAEMNGPFLYAHVIMSYVAVLITLFLIFRSYKSMVALRWTYFRSDAYQNSFAARTIMMTHVPRQLQSDAALNNLLSGLGLPYPTTGVHIGRVVGSLPELIEKHEEEVRKLEHVLAKYLKDPNGVAANRPTLRINKAAGVFGGEKVDAIDYHTAQINKLEAAIENWRERIAEKKPESYGFASLAAVPYAHAAAKSLRKTKPQGIIFELAAEPRNILWKNLILTGAQKFRLSSLGFMYLTVLMFVNAVPLLAVALIAQMASFTTALGFLREWQSKSSWTFSLVAALVPPAISGAMGYFFPILMRKIAKYRGAQTRTKLDKVVTGQFYGFLVVSQFIVFSLIGVFITSVASVVGDIVEHQSAGQVFDTLRQQTDVIKKQFLNMSNYWLTWLPLRMWMCTFDLAQGVKLVLVWVQKAFFGRTPRDVREYTKPPSFEYAIYYGNFLFVFAVGAIYGVLAPLVMIFTAIVFWVAIACYKYNFMYVNVSKVESGGGLWRVVVNRLLVTLILMQVVLMFVVSLDDSVSLTDRIVKIALCAPPILLVLIFKVYCRNRFDQTFDWYIPDSSEMAHVKVHHGDQRHHRLQRRFGHPSLHKELFTPMVHARYKHLLPQVYRGRLEHSGLIDVAGRKMEAEEVMGGLKIATVEDDQLEYDPKMDSDTMSVFSTSTRFTGQNMRKGTNDTNFQGQYQAYLASGNVSRNDLPDAYEMNDMRDSQENLLEKQRGYGTSFAGAGAHGRKSSNHTLQSYGTPYATPGLEYPPMDTPGSALDLGQQQLSHHPNPSTGSLGGGYFSQGNNGVAMSPPPQQYYGGAGVGGGQLRTQRSNGSFGAAMAMQPPRRTESPLQMSSPPAGATRIVGSRGPSPGTYPSTQSPPMPYSYAAATPTPASFYDAADMYGGGQQAQAPPYQQQAYGSPVMSAHRPTRQASGFDPYQQQGTAQQQQQQRPPQQQQPYNASRGYSQHQQYHGY